MIAYADARRAPSVVTLGTETSTSADPLVTDGELDLSLADANMPLGGVTSDMTIGRNTRYTGGPTVVLCVELERADQLSIPSADLRAKWRMVPLSSPVALKVSGEPAGWGAGTPGNGVAASQAASVVIGHGA